MKVFLVLIALAPAALHACAGDVPAPARLVIEWPRDTYLLVAPGNAAGTEAIVEKLSRRLNLRFVGGHGKGSGAALVSPRGQLLASFDSAPGEKDLAPYFRSPGHREIRRGLEDNGMVVVVYAGPAAKRHKRNLSTADDAARDAGRLFEAAVTRVELVVTEHAGLVRNLGLLPDPGAQGFVIVFGRGKTLAPVHGEVKRNDILDRIQYLVSPVGCVFPHEFGEDLLLEW